MPSLDGAIGTERQILALGQAQVDSGREDDIVTLGCHPDADAKAQRQPQGAGSGGMAQYTGATWVRSRLRLGADSNYLEEA